MKRLIFACLIVISVVSMPACAGRDDTNVVIAGSTSILPYVEILAEEYRFLYPDNVVGVQGGGSSAGIKAIREQIADIGMSSRSLNDDERDLWSAEIALDALAIIVHKDNPVENLTIEQVRAIYTRSITNWSEVGGRDARIHIISREEGSGTRSAFQELVMADEFISQRAVVQNSNGAVRQVVSGNLDTIGFISLGLALEAPEPGRRGGVKPLMLDGIKAEQENVLNGSYELYRAFLFVSEEEPAGSVKHFVDFILSEAGQKILMDEGLISVSGRIIE
jgi:phosphate transport system substrate-binding protein